MHALLTLVSFARPSRVFELGARTGHATANLTEWTDLESMIVSIGGQFSTEINHFGKSSKIQLSESGIEKYKPFDVILIHESSNADWILHKTIEAYQMLAPGGWLIWLGFLPNDVSSPTWNAVELAQLADRVFHFAGTRVAYLQKSPRPPKLSNSFSIYWEGDVDVIHSFAAVNRGLVARLQILGHTVSISQTHAVPATPMRERHPAHFAINRPLQKNPEVSIRHSWPPNLEQRSDGVPIVLIQPWEYGSPPTPLVESLKKGDIAEWWVPSNSTRMGAIDAGVPEDRVAVVPNGVDISLFRAEGEKMPLRTRKKFKFLFVGGTIWRKGFDLLLKAYEQAFSASDDVCLVVKDCGVATHYQGQTAHTAIQSFQKIADAPELEYHHEDMTDTEMAQLYRAADCLVHPYRAESFGMPVAEAMACGIPAIVPQHGSTDDWCDQDNTFLIPSRRVILPPRPVCGLETVGNAWYLEPDLSSLIEMLRFVVANPRQVQIKGQNAAETIRTKLTWDHAARGLESRLHKLLAKRARKPGQRVSLTMIVRNEESNLADCLGWINDLFDEIVIVDTGSEDLTKEIATAYGAKVYDYPWTDSFADARNHAIEQATGDWIFWLDADDRVDSDNRLKLEILLTSLRDEQSAFLMNCRCKAAPGGIESRVDHVRLFRRDDHIRWRYRVHEQILPALQENNTAIHWSDVVITHVGYTNPDLMISKLNRDLRLLIRENHEHPDDPLVAFQLGAISHRMRQFADAIQWLNQSLRGLQPGDSILPKTYVLLAQCHREIGQKAQALEILHIGSRLFSDDAELLYLEGTLHYELHNFHSAENCFKKLLSETGSRKIESVTEGLRGYLGRHMLALVLFETGRFQEACEQWQQVIRERPGFIPAVNALEETRQRIAEYSASTRG